MILYLTIQYLRITIKLFNVFNANITIEYFYNFIITLTNIITNNNRISSIPSIASIPSILTVQPSILSILSIITNR
jgi:hypothetical protein